MKNLLSFLILWSFTSNVLSDQLDEAIKSDLRNETNVSRDTYRNPYKTLTFFGIKPNMKVVELSPGGGWYTEILASYLHDSGTLIAAHFDKNSDRDYFKRGRANFEKKMTTNTVYKNIEIVDLSSNLSVPQSADAVLTFRNLHNWLGPQADLIFSNSYKVLKTGGVFGIVEHRAKAGTSIENMKKSGYVTEEYAIQMAEKHGFKLISKSEINSNPKDTTNHPKGVWTLPPNLRLKEVNREKYLNIGESDRMTLLFKKL